VTARCRVRSATDREGLCTNEFRGGRLVRPIRHRDVLGALLGVAIGEQLTAVVANYMASVVSMSAPGKDAPTRIGHRHEPGRNWPASGRGCAKESPERVVQQPVRTSTGVGSIRHCDVLIPAGRGRGRALAAGGQGSVTSSHSDYLSAIRHRGRSRSVRAASRIGGGGGVQGVELGRSAGSTRTCPWRLQMAWSTTRPDRQSADKPHYVK
jgi:hypothetical protein